MKPGLIYGMDEATYRAQHDWLSVSGAKKLLPPSCPAKYAASVGVEEHRPQFDVGKAFHAAVLGDGAPFESIATDSWRSKEARDFRDDCYARGVVPLLAEDAATVEEMAAAVKAHDVASLLFQGGAPEVSAFWVDPDTGVQCKARFDYLPDAVPGRRLIVPDLKSAVSSDPQEFARAAARYGYVNQQCWYSDALVALGVDPDPAFVFVVVEKEWPHVVTVGQFTTDADVKLSRAANDKARRIYAECAATDTWPGHPGVTQLALPNWHLYQLEEMLA